MSYESKPIYQAAIVGHPSELQLVRGWHERERDMRHDIPYRASLSDGLVVLRREPASTQLCLLLSGPVGLHQGPMTGYVVINRAKHELPLSVDAWVLRTYPLETDKEILRIHLFHDHPVVPDQIIGNGDARRLGWFLSAIWQE